MIRNIIVVFNNLAYREYVKQKKGESDQRQIPEVPHEAEPLFQTILDWYELNKSPNFKNITNEN